MPTEWTRSLEIGVPVIDAQHRNLLRLLNELGGVVQSDAQGDFHVVDDVFNELELYIRDHFRDEEELMQRIGYEFNEQHRKEHRELSEQVTQYRSLFSGGKIGPREMHEWLLRWLLTHIAGSDTLIADFMRRRGITLSVP